MKQSAPEVTNSETFIYSRKSKRLPQKGDITRVYTISSEVNNIYKITGQQTLATYITKNSHIDGIGFWRIMTKMDKPISNDISMLFKNP